MPHPFSTLACALCLCALIPAQQVLSSHELVADGLGGIDDIEVSPSGEIYLSFPSQGFVGQRTSSGTTVTWVPVASGFILAMALDATGTRLWTADWLTGDVCEVDLASGQVLQTLTGFGFPIDLVVKDPNTLLVGGMDIQDTIHGLGTVYSVDLAAPAGPATTILTSGLPGALDMEFNSQGRLFTVSLLSPTLDEVQLTTGLRTPVMGGLLQPADLIKGPGNTLYVSTLVAGEVLKIDPDPTAPSLTQITALLGGSIGPGCEDMALEPSGQLLVSLNNGSVRRVLLNHPLVQQGTGLANSSFNLLVREPSRPAWTYQLVASFAQGVLPLAGTPFILPVVIDPLFLESVNPASGLFIAFGGQLDSQGSATASVNVPALQSGLHIPVVFGLVIWDFLGPIALVDVPDFLEVCIIAL